MMAALVSSETSALTRATRHNIPEDAIQLAFNLCTIYGVFNDTAFITLDGIMSFGLSVHIKLAFQLLPYIL
jgi:hypothetical protein